MRACVCVCKYVCVWGVVGCFVSGQRGTCAKSRNIFFFNRSNIGALPLRIRFTASSGTNIISQTKHCYLKKITAYTVTKDKQQTGFLKMKIKPDKLELKKKFFSRVMTKTLLYIVRKFPTKKKLASWSLILKKNHFHKAFMSQQNITGRIIQWILRFFYWLNFLSPEKSQILFIHLCNSKSPPLHHFLNKPTGPYILFMPGWTNLSFIQMNILQFKHTHPYVFLLADLFPLRSYNPSSVSRC